MGKATYLGLKKQEDPLFSSGPEVFSPLKSRASTMSSARNTAGENPAKSNSADETEQEGIRAEAIRREQYRLSMAPRK